jgi:SAM-dependent methyltransferase
MSSNGSVEEHYTSGRLVQKITTALATLGKAPRTVTIDDLAPVDEFHIGGRQATEEIVGQLNLSRNDHVLEIGSGLGGAARFVADRFGCRVSGIDLTGEYVETGRVLNEWVGLAARIAFHHGSALDTTFDDAAFDAAYMLHVGMNIADKERLFAEVARVLKPGATFAIYDVMTTGGETLDFPVPWARGPETSAVATPVAYKAALTAGGFKIVAERNRRDFAIEFFENLRARTVRADGPPPLGLHMVMGADAATKIANMIGDIEEGRVAPVEIFARRGPD